ncbi:MAG TPA: putative peptidoglycan glycosyltransferase FtsW [Candidatus Hydrogenedentes bacterium]|nr:putative peptidoglycan glycosyltransferase FtsW [Candidatus Hydrogenedentota bacterium]
MRRETTAILLIVLALLSIGLITIYSVAAVKTNGMSLFWRQAACVAVGLGLMLYLATFFDYHRFGEPLFFRGIVGLALLLLVAVLIPGIGVEVNGATRWIRLPIIHQFQPSEIAKFALILLLARKLAENRDRIATLRGGFLPMAAITGAFVLLVLMERDLGIPAVMGSVAFLMIFMGGARWFYVFGSAIAGSAFIVAMIKTSPYRWQRLISFLDPFAHRNDGGFHLIQSLAAFARGSYGGVGPGAGEQKLFYLPAAHTDFIFAVWGEEMGLLGTALVVAMFVAFLLLGMRIANAAPDLFGSLLAAGITMLISLQAAFNMGVTIGLLPTKGLTLPFVSYGGTAQIVFLAMAGILMNIGLQAGAYYEVRQEFAVAH